MSDKKSLKIKMSLGQTIWDLKGSSDVYNWYKSQDGFDELRKWMDKAYFKEGLCQYLDGDFLHQLRNNDFYARLWELELSEWLWLTKLKLIPTNGSGPDFCVEIKNQKIWIEVVLANPDEELTKFWNDHLNKGVFDFPKDQMALRYSAALVNKARKIQDNYIGQGLIADKDIVLIAVSGFPPNALHPDMEHFFRAILPMGDPVVHFTTDGSPLDESILRSTHTSLLEYTKRNGSPVYKQFLYPGDHLPFVDGVLFTEASNLQSLLGVSSTGFSKSTNVPHIFPNYASTKKLPTEFTDYFYLHNFVDGSPMISLEQIDPKNELM